MLEQILKEGNSTGWLPRNEASGRGNNDLCQIDIVPNLYYGARYIPFAPNGINWIAQDGRDVISFNFSGCIMAVFNHQGVTKVGHISTGNNQDCLQKWDQIKRQSTNVFEFKPHLFIDTKRKQLSGCYGLITSDLQTYSITVVLENNKHIIASVNRARLL